MKYTPKNQSLAIMQPYFLPYIGYFQLINAVDNFIIYDNIQYSKKYFISKNQFLQNNKPCIFSLALKKDSDYLDINKRYLSASFDKEKLLDSIYFAYKKAPYQNKLMPLLESILYYPRDNLFDFIYHSILKICIYIGIDTNIFISSTIPINHELKAQDKVIAFCKNMQSSVYINSIGGTALYNELDFKAQNIELKFIKVDENIKYNQLNSDFVPNLSIIDIIAFNSKDNIKEILQKYMIQTAMGGGCRSFIYFIAFFVLSKKKR